MILKNFILSIFIATLFFGCNKSKQKPRITVSINTNWTFNYIPDQQLDKSIFESNFIDSDWPVTGIPHTWQTYETTGDLHPFIKNASERDDPYWWKGWGYYRKRFIVANKLANKKIEIEFDGVQKYSRIYLNGEYLGDHKGGFNSFYFDLTPHIKFGEENILVVAVNNRRDDKYRIPPMNAGNWNVYGGIYRDVRLVTKNKIYIPYQGSYKHEGGTFITTPIVDKDKGEVCINTFIKNDLGKKVAVKLKSTILDPDGKKVEIIESQRNIDANEFIEVVQNSATIANPKLWHPQTPNVYKVLSEVYYESQLVDVLESQFGFRWFYWDYQKDNLWLNGEIMPVRGFNRHQEYPWVGDAIPKWLTTKNYKDMKNNLGTNFIRAAHYPNDPQVYNLTDELGIVAVEEVPNIKSIDFSEEVQKQNVQEMIRRDRNHPSILFWSVGNETSDAADSKWIWEEDTTRIIHARKAHEAGEYVQHDHTNLDMENLLRVTVRGFFDKDNAPTDRDFEPEDGQFCSLEEWQHQRAMMEGGSVRGSMKKNVVFWLYEDHGADREYKNSPLLHLNYKGWVDLYHFPKYVYYLTQAMYTEDPMVFVHPHNWTPKYIGQSKDFIVNSNCDKVELFVDAEKISEAFPDYENYNTVTFGNVEIKEGVLKAVGTKNGKTVENIVAMSGKPKKLKLTTSHTKINVGKNGLAIITADILDENNNRVIHANNVLNWVIEGEATLVGPAVYKNDFDLVESMEGTGYIRVPVSNVIRSANKAGKARISVWSPGLESASLEIDIIEKDIKNDLIFQPLLADIGRARVSKDENYKPVLTRVEELKKTSGNRTFNGLDKSEMRKRFTEFVLNANPEFDVSLVESKFFLDWFGEYLIRSDGVLVGDDYNFKVDQYNDCRYLSKAIDQSNLLFTLASQLAENYSNEIIAKGNSIDIEATAQLFLDLPKERLILRVSDDEKQPAPWISPKETRGTRSCVVSDFNKFVVFAYPGFKQLSAKQKAKYFKYLEAINPELQLNNGTFNVKKGDQFCLPDPEGLGL